MSPAGPVMCNDVSMRLRLSGMIVRHPSPHSDGER